MIVAGDALGLKPMSMPPTHFAEIGRPFCGLQRVWWRGIWWRDKGEQGRGSAGGDRGGFS